MKFALFSEIPVARPWDDRSEHRAYHDVVEQAVLADRLGWDAFWTVEHHFLEEYSHCSNPEVLYGMVAAKTEHIRIGYGVRLMPKPYNHPVRTAESVAVLDLLSNGRVDLGAGRSATRLELEGFGIDPAQTRSMWREALHHVVGCWTHDEYEFAGEHWQMPRRRVLPKPYQRPHPPLWGATTSDEGHREVGQLGLGLCSFAVGVPPEEIKRKVEIYREGISQCTSPVGAFVNDQAATFTMMTVAPTREEAAEAARRSFEWYPVHGARQIAALADYLDELNEAHGNFAYAGDLRAKDHDGLLGLLSLEILQDLGACVCGTPDDAYEMCKRYEDAGIDLLLCLIDPYDVSQEACLQTIEMMARHVIPEFR